MAKIKLTKGELKKQRDALRQYQRYLPTLQLKKQQLQMEILRQLEHLDDKVRQEENKRVVAASWSGLISAYTGLDLSAWIKHRDVVSSSKNIAGVEIPVFEKLEFDFAEYDLFAAPLWLDAGIDVLRGIVSLRKEIEFIKQGVEILKHELRITAQRVNLFEKVKIPEAEEAIRLIKIYLGDQNAAAVGRSKIAKKKIEQVVLEEVGV